MLWVLLPNDNTASQLMPRFEGLPYGPCPGKRNDQSVRLGEGELMLCKACDSERHRMFLESKKNHEIVDDSTTTKDEVVAKSADGDQRVKAQNRTRSVRSESSVESVKVNTRSLDTSANTVTIDRQGSVVFSELLMYTAYQRNRCTNALLRSVLNEFYSTVEISEAKKQLVSLFESSLTGCEAVTERRNSVQRTASAAEVDDITDILDLLDNLGVLDNVTFGAVQYNRLPRYGPEDLNICAIADKQVSTENSLSALSAKVESLSDGGSQSVKLLEAVSDVNAELRSLQSQVTQLAATVASVQPEPHRNMQHTDNTRLSDRLCNVVIYGVPESRDSNVWKSGVMNVLQVAAGREVSVSDAFRLGRYDLNKCRPILVKLHSVWDKRTVLSGSRKLAAKQELRTIFVQADEPMEVRRRKALDRIKARAVARGDHVNENSDVLYVNDIAVYSLCNGYIRNNVNLSSVAGSASLSRDG